MLFLELSLDYKLAEFRFHYGSLYDMCWDNFRAVIAFCLSYIQCSYTIICTFTHTSVMNVKEKQHNRSAVHLDEFKAAHDKNCSLSCTVLSNTLHFLIITSEFERIHWWFKMEFGF